QALQAFLLELQRARGDEKTAVQAAPPSAGGAGTGSVAKQQLDAAAAALAARDYSKTIAQITAAKVALIDPKDQADALYYLAEAQAGLAEQKNDRAALQDAGLAYMRVVAHFKDATPLSPRVPLAL